MTTRQITPTDADTTGTPPPTLDEFKGRVWVQTLFSAADIYWPMRMAPDVAENGHHWFNDEIRARARSAGFTQHHDHLPLGRSPVGSMDIESRLYLADAGLGRIAYYEIRLSHWLDANPGSRVLGYYGSLDGERLAHMYETSPDRWDKVATQCIQPALDLAGPQFWVGIDSSTNDTGRKREFSWAVRNMVESEDGEFVYESWPNAYRARSDETYLVNEDFYQKTKAYGWHAYISTVRRGIRMVTGAYSGDTHDEQVTDAAKRIARVLRDDPKWHCSIGLKNLIRDGLTAERLHARVCEEWGAA